MAVNHRQVVEDCVPSLLAGHKVRLQGNDECKALVGAIVEYVCRLLGDTESYIAEQLQTVGPSKLQNRENRFVDQIRKVALIYCQVYVERVENALPPRDGNGYLVCGAALHDVEVLRTTWDETFNRFTGQGPKKPHGGRKKAHWIGFPFKSRAAS